MIDWTTHGTEEWELIVVGAGVAGAFFAGLAAQAGAKVLLLDQGSFPRHKTCGGCLGARGVQVLEQAGALVGFQDFLPIERAVFSEPKGDQVAIALSTSPTQPLALSRRELDQHLAIWAVSQGAVFIDESQVVSAKQSTTNRVVELRHNGEEHRLQAKLLVLADGLGSPLARRLGVEFTTAKAKRIGSSWILPSSALRGFEPTTISMHCSPKGYLGIVGLPGGDWNVSASFRATQPAEFLRRVLAEHKIDVSPQALEACTATVSRPLRQYPSRLAGNGFMLIGDAAGYCEPITGEGMSWALESAVVAFRAFQEKPDRAPALYETRFQKQRKRRHRVPFVLTELTSRPVAIRLAAGLQRYSLFPQRLVERYLNSPSNPKPFATGIRL